VIFAGAAIVLLTSCGGGGSSTKPTTATTTTPSTCTTTVSAPVGSQNIVTVAGASVSGVDINVGNPQACPAINAEVLGVADLSATRLTATNTGAQIHLNSTKIVILFGKGLNTVTQVSISGQPGDFAISNQTSVTATDGTPGIQFTVFVSPTAALGARSVILRAANNDITTFTGGLEVIP
jgi:hypothetical protein